MKQLLYIFLVLFISTQHHSFAEKLSIVNDLPNAKIILDGVEYNSNAVFNIETEPGTHYVKVLHNDTVLYSKVITVEEGKATTIDTNGMNSSANIPNNTYQQQAPLSSTISIVNDIEGAKVILDGKTYNSNSIFNVKVTPGSHYVKISHKDDILYSKIIDIDANKTKTIDTNMVNPNYSKLNIKNKKVQKKELKKLKEARGTFGLGFQLQSVSGLSIKKYFGPFGIQLVGWTGNENNENYTFSEREGEDDPDYGYNIRLLWDVKEKLNFSNTPIRLFVGVGYGKDTFEGVEYHFDDTIVEKEILEAFIGIEYDTKIGSYTFGVEYRQKEITGIDYTDYTYSWGNGYSYTESIINETQTGLLFNYGYHFYF
ncbi:hypothetical protein DID78_04250 [Candidatus Marinamargulisbacteria bacterium SCGC AG-343-D04]|nr:hypothetical protein DID78_04250 [Candidatus Marinamargulisbacteria bacterium SCGC AG-343-D04]